MRHLDNSAMRRRAERERERKDGARYMRGHRASLLGIAVALVSIAAGVCALLWAIVKGA